ncbi:Phytanoyl-CoA dioxygenase domain-containing protein 1 [Lamellibrachia satsuma]|nr:Phytanoyl-CoA dioxygenase domain-containing protein 1 [Lamellibrachia satsuma]
MSCLRSNAFQTDGFVVLENFATEEEIAAMKAECFDLVEKMNPNEHHTVFSTTKQTYRDNYFMNSADKIGYFFEDGALDANGMLQVDKQKSLNKIGHALHVLCPAFKRLTFSNKAKSLVKSLDYDDPVIVQSMYIFKQPKIGGEVTLHQDATYLYTQPLKVMGLWLALEDATEENGCLSFIPGSHKGGLVDDYRMVRNKSSDGPSCVFTAEKPNYDKSGAVLVPVKKGSLIAIDGLVIHQSETNTSDKSRHIYTIHFYDNKTAKWNDQNWLQPTEANTFVHMFEVSP